MIHITKKENCCGCSACVQSCPKSCISLTEDIEGFLYPQVDANACINCGLCEKVCPVINQDLPKKPLAVYAAKNNDEDIRMQSSSGGVFTMLAEKTISEGGVVFGAKFDNNWNVCHSYTETIEGLQAFRGSKYLQSVIGGSYKQVRDFLKEGRKILFTGTPCQVAGLRLFLRKHYDNLLLVDIVCHGVPSPKVWREYLQDLVYTNRVDGNNLASSEPIITGVSFRDKQTGWKKYGFKLWVKNSIMDENTVSNINKAKNPFIYEMADKNIFMRGFLQNLYLRPSCHNCPAKLLKSNSDITIADYWGIQNVLPDMDDDKGINLVTLNTPIGKDIFMSLDITKRQTTYEDALRSNPSLETSCRVPELRSYFWRRYSEVKLQAVDDIATNPPLWFKLKFILRRVKYKLTHL